MIQLNNLPALMLRVVEEGLVVMLSKVRDGYYSLYFGDHERSLRFMYHEEDELIIQYADKEHSIIEFDDIDKVAEYVFSEFCKEA